MRPGWRLGALALWGLVISLVGVLVGVGTTTGEEPNRAGLVVAFADGHTEVRCVEFAEEEISGVELLRRSGLTFVFSGSGAFGEAVCRIGDTGCNDPGACFCQCRGAECAFWAYFALESDRWRFQAVGASQRRLRNGDTDGWVWGSGSAPPGAVTFEEVCPHIAPIQATSPPVAATVTATPSVDTETTPTVSLPASGPRHTPTISVLSAGPTDLDESMPTASAEGRPPTEAASGLERDAAVADETNGGPPVGLIAFGVVAGLLAAAIGGVVLRRRFGG